MTVPNDTQTIDADALRARLAEMAQRARDEMTPAGLRERIAAALRARHGDGVNIETTRRRFGAPVWGVGVDVGDTVRHLVAGESATEAEALATLARAIGLNPDGTDPRDQGEALARRLHAERESVVAELDRARDETDALRALLEVAQTSLAAATSGRRVTVVDEIERLQRERDAHAAEVERLRGVMRREIANTDHVGNCPMYGTADDADPRCNCVVGALYHALAGGSQ